MRHIKQYQFWSDIKTNIIVITALLANYGAAQADEVTPKLSTQNTTNISDGQFSALTMSVSFEAKRQPLVVILINLEKQSGVKLTTVSTLADVPVTACVKDVPLRTVMGALERLYATQWHKITDTSFQLESSPLNELDQELSQLGDPFILPGLLREGRTMASENWSEALTQNADLDSLKQRGVPITNMPEDLQRKIKIEVQENAAYQLLKLYANCSTVNALNCIARIEAGSGHKLIMPPILTVRTPSHNLPLMLLYLSREAAAAQSIKK